MGVPKFYRWISERYPKINQVITDSALLPEFDHLYLDMNGIIHGCTHPSHLDVSETLSERDMMLGIMHYIDRIVTQIVKPKVSLYMAIDGVAPRAKLNQQRSRRFRSAKDMKDATKNAKSKSSSLLGNNHNGSDLAAESSNIDAFDSNCITPGTEFMARVSNTIKYFIRKKIQEDPLWRNLKVIFSGHEIPGEGEHKIMQHIRNMKNQPGYQPNTRHCMYGQDADLIMLGLVSHEPHFTLLREIVDFGGGFNRNKNALKTVKKFTKESDFQLLHLSILREYLEIEFASDLEKGTYNLEAIIDDFVFMTFLVGNDFLPHMPSLDIGENAFDLLFNTYKEQRVSWGQGQYLTDAGNILDPARLEAYLAVIGDAETDIFQEREINEGIYLKKRRKWDKRDGKASGPTDGELAEEEEAKQQKYLEMLDKIANDPKLKDMIDVPQPGQKDFKGRYYFEKLKFTPMDIDSHLALRKAYVEGLLWCLAYYYRGCISWGWFYPYHYGPLLSDLKGLPEIFKNIQFEVGAPLKPFEQLMGCLPPASAKLVPKPYRILMSNPESPIKQFYPEEFDVDMNGKRNPWEGVNLLPFIDITLLQETIAKHCPDKVLTLDERNRNSKGEVLCYTHDFTVTEDVPSCNRSIGIPDITCSHSRVDVIKELEGTEVSFKPELVPGTQIPYPGFPSLNVIPIAYNEMNGVGLNCFGSASKYATRVLTLHQLPQLPGASVLAEKILGTSLFINWPMMHEAKVVAVSDSTCEVRSVKGKPPKVKVFKPNETENWEAVSATKVQQYLAGNGIPGSGGVNIGDIQIRLKLKPLQGMKTSPIDGSTKKVFGKEEAEVPLQMVLWNAPAPDPRFTERGPLKLQDRFPAKTNVLLTKGKYRGCVGTVLGVADKDKVGIRVKVIPPEPPFGLAIARSLQDTYVSSNDAAKLLQMTPGVFLKITGSISFDPGRYDLGLNLRYKEGLCVLGYSRIKSYKNSQKARNGTKKNKINAWATGDSLLVVGSSRVGQSDDQDVTKPKMTWEFTPEAIRLVAAYRRKFPQIFAWVSKYPNERFYNANKVFGPGGEATLPKVREWLDNVESAKLPRSPASTVSMPLAGAAAVQRAADIRLAAQQEAGPPKETNIRIAPSAIFVEGSVSPTSVIQTMDYNDSSPPELGDRIANLCANGLTFGARGTVVSIHDATTGCVEVIMDEEFVGGSTLQGACSNFRGKLCLWAHLLKISAADSKDVVEKLIPAGIAKTTNKVVPKVEKLIDQKEPLKEDLVETTKIAPNSSTPSKTNTHVEPKVTPAKATIPSRAVPGSTGRGTKQGAWKEALGPQEKSAGFRGVRHGLKDGYRAWHKYVTNNNKKKKEDTLKSMLGVKTSNAPLENGTPTSSDATAALKAKLGLGILVPKNEPPPSDDLMSIPLPPPPQPSQPQPPPPPAAKPSATRALEDLMMRTSIAPPTHSNVMHQTPQSAFNFTYVQEGEKPPVAPVTVPPPMQPHPNMGVPPQMMGMAPYHAGFYPPPSNPMPPPPAQYANSVAPTTVPRDKKGSAAVNGSETKQNIVPSAVVTKIKK